MRAVAIAAVLLSGGAVCAAEGAWPSFRGPTGQGRTDVALPVRWSASESVRWKCELPGEGWSSPVIWSDDVWLTTASHNGASLRAVCVDLSEGTVRFDREVFAPVDVQAIHHSNSYASPTPCLDAERVYVHFGRYGTAALDRRSGEILWRNRKYVIDHQGGPGSSPVLAGGVLILTFDGADGQFLVGLDPETGTEVWRTERSAPFRPNPILKRAFSTPVPVRSDGVECVLSAGADQLHAYVAESGEEMWHVRYEGFSTVPAPVTLGDQVVFCTGYFQPDMQCYTMNGRGDITSTARQWSFRGPVPDISSPVIADGKVFFVSTRGVATALEMETGRRVWAKRLGGEFSASPIVSGRTIYFCNEEGLTFVVQLDEAGKPQLIGTNRLGEAIKASPAVAGRDLLIRTRGSLYRITSADPDPEPEDQ